MAKQKQARSIQPQVAADWLKFTLENLRENLVKMKIHNTGDLLASVHGALVLVAGGDVEKLTLGYAAYGKFVDMGVGRGMGAGVRREQKVYAKIRDGKGQLYRYKRKKKMWASREIGRQSFKLGELMSVAYGERLIATISDSLPGTIDINLQTRRAA